MIFFLLSLSTPYPEQGERIAPKPCAAGPWGGR